MDGYIYFKNGDVVNAKFGDLDKEPAVSFLISKISDKVVTMNFSKSPKNSWISMLPDISFCL